MITRQNGSRGRPIEYDWDQLPALHREMDQIFGRLGRPWTAETFRPTRAAEGPLLEMIDEGDRLIARIDLPGFREEDVGLDLERNTLTLRAERSAEAPEGYKVHRHERRSITLSRTLALPYRVLAGDVEATLMNGVLEVTLPKAPEEQPRKIAVRGGR